MCTRLQISASVTTIVFCKANAVSECPVSPIFRSRVLLLLCSYNILGIIVSAERVGQGEMAHHKCNIHGVHYDLTDWQGGGGGQQGQFVPGPQCKGGPPNSAELVQIRILLVVSA